MAAEFIAWKGCPLQRELGPDGFVSRLKLLQMKRVVDAQIDDPEERDNVTVQAQGADGAVHELDYVDIAAATGTIEAGIPDCSECMLSHQLPVGCHRGVSYPIDAPVETLLFDFFTTTVVSPESTAFELWRDVVQHQPTGSAWHTMRGSDGHGLAELPEPLSVDLHLPGDQHVRVDSAMLLSSLFLTSEGNAQVVAYHKWWTQLLNFSERPGRWDALESSRTWAEILEVRRLYLRAFIFGMHEPVGLLINV